MQMVFNSRAFLLTVLSSLVCHLASTTFSLSTQQNIACLRAIKSSLEDPFNRLKWNIDNLMAGFFCEFNGIECWNDGEIKVLRIVFNDMGLRGQFPRGVKNCSSLQELDLSGNKLSGPIPEDLSHLIGLIVKLDLSNNRFSGEIPLSIAYITYLNYLMLDNNQLTGQIPQELGYLQRIKRFSVSNNLLWGPVPKFLNANISQESYANNKGLCGGPLKPCKDQEHQWRFIDSWKSGFIVGFALFLVSFVTVFMFYCVPWVHMEKGKKTTITTMTILMFKRSGDDQLSQLPSVSQQIKIKEADKLSKAVCLCVSLCICMCLIISLLCMYVYMKII